MADSQLARTWRDRIASCARSGMSIQRWCELNGTTYRQYGYWKKRLATLPAPDTPEPKWTLVQTQENVRDAQGACLTLRIAGAEINLTSGFDPCLLRAVVRALGEEPC